MIICNLCARNLGVINPGKRYVFNVVQLNDKGEHSSQKHSVDVCPKCAADFWSDFSTLMQRFELDRSDFARAVDRGEPSSRKKGNDK